jgi:hypothetical protein
MPKDSKALLIHLIDDRLEFLHNPFIGSEKFREEVHMGKRLGNRSERLEFFYRGRTLQRQSEFFLTVAPLFERCVRWRKFKKE